MKDTPAELQAAYQAGKAAGKSDFATEKVTTCPYPLGPFYGRWKHGYDDGYWEAEYAARD